MTKANESLPNTPLAEALSVLGIGPKDWDWLIVSDGSGTTWQQSAGWCGVLLHRHSFRRHVFSGSLSYGTNNLAEILGVAHPLWYLGDQERQPRWQKVRVLTDSQYVASSINTPRQRPKAHAALWHTIWTAQRQLLRVSATWIRRDTLSLNQLADAVAGESSRRQRGAAAAAAERLRPGSRGPSGFNPAD